MYSPEVPEVAGEGVSKAGGSREYLDELVAVLFHGLQFPREIAWV